MRRCWPLCACLCLASCTGNKYGGHPPYPTSGQVLVNGQPASKAKVVFLHEGDWGDRSIVPQAWTDEEGRFILETYSLEDGAPAGDYHVTVIWPTYVRKTLGPDRLGGKYAKPETSGLTAHVEPRTNELPPFHLEADLSKVKVEVAQPDRPGRGGKRAGR